MAQSYDNPGGSGNRLGRIGIASNINMGAGTLYSLIDGSQANDAWYRNNQSGCEIIFDFFEPRVIDEIKHYQSGPGGQGTWQVRGSNDLSSWTDLGSTYNPGASATVTHSFTNSTAYRYYGLFQTAGTTSSGPWVREIEFRIDESSYWSTFDQDILLGDRTAVITISTNATISLGTIDNLIDGAWARNSSDALELWLGNPANRTITLDFGSSPRRLTGLIWFQSTQGSHGEAKLQGSNNNSTWSDVSSSQAWGGAQYTFFDASANTRTYRYYRIYQTSGEVSNNPWCLEIAILASDAPVAPVDPPAATLDFDNITHESADVVVGYSHPDSKPQAAMYLDLFDAEVEGWGSDAYDGHLGAVQIEDNDVTGEGTAGYWTVRTWTPHPERSESSTEVDKGTAPTLMAVYEWAIEEIGGSDPLDSEHEYGAEARVAAWDDSETGDDRYIWSEPVKDSFTTQAANERPDPPTLGTDNVTRTGFDITAEGSDPEEDEIVYRQVQVSAAGGSEEAFLAALIADTGDESAPQGSYSLSELDPGTTYYFRARDADAGGFGDWTDIASQATLASHAPAAPDVSVDDITRSSAEISAGSFSDDDEDPWAETQVRVIRADTSEVVYGPATLFTRSFPVVATGLPADTALIAQVRDADDVDGYGDWGSQSFNTLANQAPTAPTITSPSAGFVDLLEPIELRATTATDPEGDAITYRWRYAVKDSEEWTDIPGAVDLEAPAFDWNALPFLNIGTLYDLQVAAVDAFGATTWSESVTIRAGAGTATLYEDFSAYAPNEELDWTNGVFANAGTVSPGAPKSFFVRGFPGTHGNRAAELYNGHGIAYQHLRTYITLWEEAGELTRPCAVLGFRLRHGNVATDNARPFAGVALACDLEPITTSGYRVFVGATGISGHAKESDGGSRGLKVVASSPGFLKPDYPYRLEVRLAGQAVVTSTTVKKSYLDYVAGLGPYQGYFSRVQVPVGVIVAEVYDDLTDELVMSATLHHRREPSHDEDFYVLGGSHIPIEGYCGLAIGDYSGSMIADYVAFRELDLPELPPERTERYARWRAPFFGSNAPYELAPAWEPVVDPQGRTILYRLDRVDMEADEPAYEEILEAQAVAPIGGLCALPPIDTTMWRQSRGWRLALQHSVDGGDTWSERILTPRFLVDRSEGTASTGFTEYQPGVNPSDWIPVWGNPVYYPTDVAGSADNRALIHKNNDGIFGMYVGNGIGWFGAGQRRQVAVWATQRCNSVQATIGVLARAVPSDTNPFAYYFLLKFGYTGDFVQVGLRGKNAQNEAAVTAIYSNDYHMVLEAETLEDGTVELRGFLWRAELEDRPTEPTVVEVITRPGYINQWGMAGLLSYNAPIHGAGGGSRLRECDEFCVTGLEPLPDDRPELPDGEPNPVFEPNPAPLIQAFCPECPTDTPPTIVVEAATRSSRPANWFDTDVDDITVPEI